MTEESCFGKGLFEDSLDAAEDILGHKFTNRYLLESALTHPSAAKHTENSHNYERLEFLGDSILGAIIANEIFTRFPNIEEGGLTRIKVSLVAGTTLSKVAADLGIGELIIFGDSEQGTKGRGLHSALENVYEACVAALFLDGGIQCAHDFVLRTLGPYINEDLAAVPESPKSSLQEILQANKTKPEYKILEEVGPPHNRLFRAGVYVDGKLAGTGSGHSKKEAEAAAASAALKSLKPACAQ